MAFSPSRHSTPYGSIVYPPLRGESKRKNGLSQSSTSLLMISQWNVSKTVFTCKTRQLAYRPPPECVTTSTTTSVKVHLLKLSDGKPHPRARRPILKYDILLSPTESGQHIESTIWGNRLGCPFTSTSENESADILAVWDWTSGDLVRVRAFLKPTICLYLSALQVLSQYGNSFMFLNDQTIVAGHTTEDGGPSLAFSHLASDETPAIPLLTLALPGVDVKRDIL
jgi:hypothetical protein